MRAGPGHRGAGEASQGVKRSKKVFTTKSDPAAVKPADLLQRKFHAVAPRRLWVADITCLATWSGFAYVAFVTDIYSRRIVSWNVAATLKADFLPLQALDMAVWEARREGAVDLTGLVHHADHGSDSRSSTPTGSASSVRSPRPARSGTPSITHSPRPSTGSTRPSSSEGEDRGERSSRPSSRFWITYGGGTTSACTESYRCAPRSRSRRRTLPKNHPSQHSLAKETHRHETQCDSGQA